MEVVYITKDDTIVFSPKFDKSLNCELLSNHKKIIFSDYELNNNLFDAYENNKFTDLGLICSSFDQPLTNSLNNLTSLTHLTFGWYFNQPLDNSLDKLTSLTQLTFGYCFNQPLTNSLNNLTYLTRLTFGNYFNQPLDNSLDNLTSLTHLTLGWNFNQPLGNSLNNLTSLTHLTLGYYFDQKDDLPFNVTSISLNCDNAYYTNYLTDSIEEIEFGHKFNLELNNLPSSIKKIVFNKGSNYDKELNCLPNGLEILQLPFKYNLSIQNIPLGLKN